MALLKRPSPIVLAVLWPVVLMSTGTLGYRLIEGWSLFDSLYMAVITLTTVGFGEVHPLSTAGRAFTIVLVLGGVFTFFYAATEVIGGLATGKLQRYLERQRMDRSLAAISHHMIVCGYGRMGQLVCADFVAQKLPFVVIERRGELLQGFDLPGGLPLQGDATDDALLRRAGIDRARALLSVVASDADNLFITLSARLLNEKLLIVARADSEAAMAKMERAGANRVVSPYIIGGTRVAQAALRPNVVDFLELATRAGHLELQLEETTLGEKSRLTGRSLLELGLPKEFGIIVVAVRRKEGTMLFNPSPDERLATGDTLISLGNRRQLDRLDALARLEG